MHQILQTYTAINWLCFFQVSQNSVQWFKRYEPSNVCFKNTTLPSWRLPSAVKIALTWQAVFFRCRHCEADVIEMKLADYENGVNKYGQVLIKCLRESKR